MKRGRSWVAGPVMMVLAAAGLLWAQKAEEKPDAARPARLVVRVGVDLVQVDAVVTDKKGAYVTDLKAEDFEIVQDGKPREIVHCEYVIAAPEAPPSTGAPVPPGDAPPPPSFTPLRREDVRRVMAFVVDDLNLSADGIHRVSEGLSRAIREDQQPGDLIAIVRTGGGMGLLHQFTNDRRILEAAVKDVRNRPPGMGLADEDVDTGSGARPGGFRPRDHFLAKATFATLRDVLATLRTLPGRKSAVLFSERLQIQGLEVEDDILEFDPTEGWLATAVREVTDLANRSSTVLYAVDPRGPATLGIAAHSMPADTQLNPGDQWRGQLHQDRQARIASQTGMDFLARQTGGLFLSMENRVERAVADIRDDQKGYYVLAYQPDETTFVEGRRGPEFRKLKVKVKRPGLTARSRTGFVGVVDTPVPVDAPEGRQETLAQALVSPFGASTLPIRVTPVFGHHPHQGYVVRSYIHLDASAVSFPLVEGQHQAKLQLAAAVFGDKGTMLPPVNSDLTVNIRPEKLAMVQEVGVVFELTVPVPKPGSYQMRVALRDTASGQLGSATQFVPVPDLGKERLALSGVVLGTVNARGPQTNAADVTVSAATRMSPAIRRFAPGADVSYGFAVYHPHVDKASHKPQLSSRLRLVRGGKAIFDHDLSTVQVMRPLDLPKDKKSKAVPGFVVAGTFALPKDLEPGEYAVQVAVVDGAVKKDDRKSAGQWTSLEIAAP